MLYYILIESFIIIFRSLPGYTHDCDYDDGGGDDDDGDDDTF